MGGSSAGAWLPHPSECNAVGTEYKTAQALGGDLSPAAKHSSDKS